MSFAWWRRRKADAYRQGIDYYNERRFAEACQAFQSYLDHTHHPNDPESRLARFYWAEARMEMGWSLLRRKEVEPARLAFEDAVEAGCRYPDLLLHLGRLYDGQSDFGRAAHYYEQALDVHPGLAEARAHLASHRLRQGSESAREELRQLLEDGFLRSEPVDLASDPEFFESRSPEEWRSAILQELELREGEERPVAEALDAFDHSPPEVARSLLEKALRIRPQYPDLHFRLGVLHARSGSLNEASACFQEALRLNPGYDDARTWLERLRAA